MNVTLYEALPVRCSLLWQSSKAFGLWALGFRFVRMALELTALGLLALLAAFVRLR